MDIVAPRQTLKIAEENEIPLASHLPRLTCVDIGELNYLDVNTGAFEPMEGTEESLPVLKRADGSLYFRFVPVRLGKVGIFVRGEYADGGFSKAKPITFDVGPSERNAAALRIAPGGVLLADVDQVLRQQGNRQRSVN